MKLLFVHDHPFYSDADAVYSGGGLPSSTWDNYLLNFDTVFVYARNSNKEKDKKVLASNKNVSFFLTNHYSSISGLLHNFKSIYNELTDLINACDIVLVRLPSALGFIAGEIAKKKKKIIWIEQVGNAKEALGEHGSILGKLAAPFFELENRLLIKKASFVSYVTETKLQKDYPAISEAVTVSISNVIIHSVKSPTEISRERFFDTKLKIGLIGGFDVKYKGQDILLKAINSLSEEIKSNIELYFVGKGDYSWLLEFANKLDLQHNIKFIGALKAGKEINDFLQEISLYVQPSLTEGMPRAAIEAMSMGCPVIGSSVGGIPDIVSTNLLHEKDDYLKLSSDILKLYSDRNILFNEAHNSLIKAEPFLLTNLNAKRIDFYEKMNLEFNKKK